MKSRSHSNDSMPRPGYKWTKQHREALRKYSESRKGKRLYELTPEIREKMRQAKLGTVGYWKGKKRSPVSEQSRRKSSESHKGEKSHLWRGGITKKNILIRQGVEYRLWREAVFKRDNWTCVWCGARNKEGLGFSVRLNADHIKPFALFPELRFSIDNGRTLCVPCHKTTDTYMGRIKNYNK